MNKIISILSALVMIVMLQSCAKNMASFDEMKPIHKGMSPEDVSKMLDMNPKDMFKVTSGDKSYNVETYMLQTSQYTTSSSSYGPGGVTYTTTTTHSSASPMICLYYEKRLVYWGFMNDFSKSDESPISELAPLIYKEYYSIYTK
ncbi:MAG: hypothetical protein U0Y96_14490 [Candidatus Kapaibacterium sp.]|nr:hypothetical protein [Bacteroidota bacterium]